MGAIDPELDRRQRLERVLALARLSLAVLLAVVLRVEGVAVRAAAILDTFVAGYAGYAWVAAALVALAGTRVDRLGSVLHWIDVAWVLPITTLTEGPNNVFLLFYLFVLVGAAYRWGLRQTAATGIIIAVALGVEAAAWQLGVAPGSGPYPALIVARSAYAIGLGLLIGYLAEDQHATRNYLTARGRVLAAVNAKAGLRASIGAVLSELQDTFDARSAVLLVTDRESATTHRWEAPAADRSLAVTRRPAAPGDPPVESSDAAARVCMIRRGARLEIEDARGRRPLSPGTPLAALLPDDASSALVGDVPFGDGWAGRLVLIEPARGAGARGRGWFATLLPQVGVSLYSVYLLGRLRSRATAMERARLARELHDGVIQSLVGLEMHVDVLRRRLEPTDDSAASELAEIQSRLRDEVLNVRELMNDIRPVSGDAEDVPGLLAGIADRFRRDSGIDARFLCTLPRVPLAPVRVRELVRITQESLVNIRKHSGARTVVIRLGVSGDHCVLTVDDDGRGFGFEGRYTLEELDRARRGPVVIKERVRQLGGTMVLDSTPGRGSRLEISFPRSEP
jgi:signal transduction histidine kinase